MKLYTGAEYLLIDLANSYGLDKELFSDRINWAKDNLDKLESMVMDAEEPLLFFKAVQSIRAVQAGKPVGHLVEVDATTSGIQIMSALTGCPTGALWTNLVKGDVRHDAYTQSFKTMQKYLNSTISGIDRSMIKDALMTSFYGSEAMPKRIFGADTPELSSFYNMAQKDLKGCWELRNDLLELGKTTASSHSWTLPDKFQTYIPSTEKVKIECEIDELDHHKFTHVYKEYKNEITTISLAANVIHSIDGYMVREVSRRCNYDRKHVIQVIEWITEILLERNEQVSTDTSKMVSLVHLDKFETKEEYNSLSSNQLCRLNILLYQVLDFAPTEVICIHDAYKAHPNGINGIRYWYAQILAELAESDLLSDIFTEIEGYPVKYENVKGGYGKKELATLIRQNSEYALS